MEAATSICLAPCGHQLCNVCAPKVDACPLCRCTIHDRVIIRD